LRYFSILLAVAVLAVSAPAMANTVASSTMWFEGTLTESGGVYTGVVNMVDEATLGIGDGISGFDVYARQGATAWFGDDPGTGPVWTSQAIGADHDGWPTWNPDTPDWYQYSLELTAAGWAIRNHAGATAVAPQSTIPQGVPMSGSMDWGTNIATETDTGAYMTAATAEIPGGAAGYGGGAGAWDMDWSWGSEVVPLQYSDFKVEVEDLGNGEFRVSMTPVPEPLTAIAVFGGIAGLGGYIRKRRMA